MQCSAPWAGTLPSNLIGTANAFEDADAWYGYGGVGDYAVSHGNTPEVVSTAHRLRDGLIASSATNVIETGEVYDLIVVGGGIAGLAAARRFLAGAPKDARCLILENHPLAGGEAKRNDFLVDGVTLTGPQGSNASVVPDDDGWYGTLWDELGLPREFEYAPARGGAKGLRIARDNYLYSMLNADELVDTGFFFSKPHVADARWVINPAVESYESLPLDPAVRRALWQLKTGVGPTPLPAGGDQWLDRISLTHRRRAGHATGGDRDLFATDGAQLWRRFRCRLGIGGEKAVRTLL
ncbi:MAG: NAD(P)-binding protein [Proteobacteria bacterium]|nr:NAD(P)-binding protein [Pseudomonadota bacterium]